MRAGAAAGEQRGALGFDGDHAQRRVPLAQVVGGAGDGAAGAHAADQDVHPAVGVPPDLRAGGLVVGPDVGGVLVLACVPGAGQARVQLLGPLDAARETERGVGELDLGAEHPQRQDALAGGVLGQHDQAGVVARRGQRREGDAGVAGGGLDDGGAGGQLTGLLRRPDHREGGPVLDAGQRIGGLQLRQHRGGRRQPVQRQPEQGGVADQVLERSGHPGGQLVAHRSFLGARWCSKVWLLPFLSPGRAADMNDFHGARNTPPPRGARYAPATPPESIRQYRPPNAPEIGGIRGPLMPVTLPPTRPTRHERDSSG